MSLAIAIAAVGGCSSGHPATASAPVAEAPLFTAGPIAPRSTFANPLDIDYRFAVDTPSRRDAADPVITLFNDEYYLFASRSGGYWHSHDMRDWQLVVPEGLPLEDDVPAVFVRDGRMFYTAGEANELYTTDDPIAGKWRKVIDGTRDLPRTEPYSPYFYNPGGFIAAGGRAGTFRDRSGNYWRVVTLVISGAPSFERRLGIFPAAFDSAGVVRTNTWLGDYPQLLPGIASDPLERNGSGWMLLSEGKSATASSTLAGHPVGLAFDEDVRTWWSAASGGVGEWLSVDLGRIERITALQLNFAEQGTRALGREEDSYQQYIVESSIDGVHWTTRIDESRETRDRPHRYVQLDTARNARFVRVTNVHAAAGGNFAIRDLRIFGESTAPRPAAVRDVVVERHADDRSAVVRWTRSPGATSYVVRFGTAPDKLYSSYEAGDVDTLTIDSLIHGVAYWFAVDAIGEGGITRGHAR